MKAVAGRSTTVDHVAAYVAVADRFGDAVAAADLRAHVPTCGAWTSYDLAVHLGNIHAWAATVVETGRPAAEQNDEPSSSRPKQVSRWYVGKAEDLYQVLRQTSPDKPCWNFVLGTGTVAFWSRRQLHETTMHLVDLDLAAGRTTDIAPDVCVDGIGEVVESMIHRMHRRGHVAALSEPLALCAVDTGDTWVVSPGRGTGGVPLQAVGSSSVAPPTARRVSGAVPDVRDRVSASADVLYRLLWKRPVPSDALTTRGDEERVHAFLGSRLTP